MVTIHRVDDFSYVLQSDGPCKTPVFLEVDRDAGTPTTAIRIAKLAADALFDKDDEHVHSGRAIYTGIVRWKFTQLPSHPFTWKTFLLKTFTNQVHNSRWNGIERLRIATALEEDEYLYPMFVEMPKPSLEEAKQIDPPEVREVLEGLTPDLWQKGIKGRLSNTESGNSISEPAFSDPFTKLAAVAHQRHESHFSAKDNFTPEKCDYRIVLDKNDALQLVPKRFATDVERNRATVQQYKDFLLREYGADKLRYGEHLMQISLDDLIRSGDGLTPEHVYRMNMVGLISEIQDLEAVLPQLSHLLSQLESMSKGLNLVSAFEQLEDQTQVPVRYWRYLYEVAAEGKEDTPRVADLIEWLKGAGISSQPSSVEALSSSSLAQLMTLLLPTETDRMRAYTGREIYGNIRPRYTIAERGDYKPWVDVQELHQAVQQMHHNDDWDYFYEKLDMVICRRQLVREHPEDGLRVGALIPAPSDKKGNRRWYRVASCETNNFGLMSYTLRPVNHDSSMPIITMYRSTATNSYNLQWAASVLNDLNRLNPPGYEGFSLLRPYQEELFHEASIPAWVGHLLWTEKEINKFNNAKEISNEELTKISNMLSTTQQLYTEAAAISLRPRSLHDLIREYDHLINSIDYNIRSSADRGLRTLGKRFDRLYDRHLTELALDSTCRLPEEKARIACELRRILKQLIDKDVPGLNRNQLFELVEALDDNVLSDTMELRHRSVVEKTQFTSQEVLHPLAAEFQSALEANDKRRALKSLEKWKNQLESWAREAGEHPDDKVERNHVLTGHSLGGAAAQVAWINYYTRTERVPLPGHALIGRFIDAPQINIEDNEKYKTFGIRHADMLRAMQMRLRISHHQEYGDLLGLVGGGEHLGATHSEEEEQHVAQFQEFDGQVLRRLEQCKECQINTAKYAHETLFRSVDARKAFTFLLDNPEEEADGDFMSTSFSSRIMGLVDSFGTDHKWKGSKNPAYDLVTKVWGVFWTIITQMESWRTSSFFDFKRISLAQSRIEDDRARHFENEDGILVVTENGVKR